jgi:ABC-type sugar transport system permease subunit
MSNKVLEKTSFGRPASIRLRWLGNPYGRQERVTGLLMVLPAFVFFVLFIGIPIARTVLLGFQKWDAITPAEWTGLENYAKLFNDLIFQQALSVTLLLTTGLTVFLTTIPMVIAALFNMGWGKFGTIGRTLLFMPGIISWVVTGALWRLILDPNLGTLNTFLGNVGLAAWQQNWLGDPKIVLYSISIAAIWQEIGLYVIIYFAGMQGIDATLYEAAAIDGASALRRFRHVTIPMLRPITIVVITLNLLNGIKMFDVVWVMTKGGPVNASATLGTYIYKVGFASTGSSNFGYGSTLSTVILFLCILAVLFQIWMNKRSIV